MTSHDIGEEVAYLRDLFQRKLLEDRAKNQLIESVQRSLAERDALDLGNAYRDVFAETLVALDRLQTETPSAELNASVVEELLEVFARRGLRAVETSGSLDLRLHEVVATVPSGDGEAGVIVSVQREGYLLGDRLLRPARVVVARHEAAASNVG